MEEDLPAVSELTTLLGRRGALSSMQAQEELYISQPTFSRLVAAAGRRVMVLGQGRSTRYALPQPIGTAAAEQPLSWIDEAGVALPFGRLSLAVGETVHVHAGTRAWRYATSSHRQLPWLLAPLRGEGFLGRALARRLAPQGLPLDPTRWSIEQVLLAALHTPDAPGALVLGGLPSEAPAGPTLEGADEAQTQAMLDAEAEAVHHTTPYGSSAGGEQAKFLLRDHDGHPLVVKFTPPRGSPFGERWHSLLHAEVMALQLLGEHGVPVAAARMLHTRKRSYLLSRRFDRVGRHGRRHVLPLWAAHEGFVHDPLLSWTRTCEALEQRRRLPAGTTEQVRALHGFGRLIGNNDMHLGNLSLFVQMADVPRGRFTLAPLYDMLPMRWRPNPASGDLGMLPYSAEPTELASPARPLAEAFWRRVADSREVGADFRQLAAEQLARFNE